MRNDTNFLESIVIAIVFFPGRRKLAGKLIRSSEKFRIIGLPYPATNKLQITEFYAALTSLITSKAALWNVSELNSGSRA